ncbi:MAG: AraC family transcriptional regulator [Spirochaetales bacterium]|nr:AraC family transcriptional regulator [Spirochaetales bacterium]
MIFEQHQFRSPDIKGVRLFNNALRCGLIRQPYRDVENHFVTDQYALVLITGGRAEYTGPSGKKWQLREGDLFQRFPGEPHSVRFHPGCSRAYLAVPAEVLALLKLTESSFIQNPVHRLGRRPDLEEEFSKLLRLSETENELFSLLVSYQSLIARCIQCASDCISPASPEGRMRLAAELLSDPDCTLGLEELAETLEMNYHSFRRQFLSWSGSSPGQYRIKGRIERAQQLLLRPGSSVGLTAEQLGYEDIYSFSRQFKKVCGISPGQFIKKTRT